MDVEAIQPAVPGCTHGRIKTLEKKQSQRTRHSPGTMRIQHALKVNWTSRAAKGYLMCVWAGFAGRASGSCRETLASTIFSWKSVDVRYCPYLCKNCPQRLFKKSLLHWILCECQDALVTEVRHTLVQSLLFRAILWCFITTLKKVRYCFSSEGILFFLEKYCLLHFIPVSKNFPVSVPLLGGL